MNDSITITKAELQAALQKWEQDARDGKCMPAEESRAQSVEDVAAASAEYLWSALSPEVVA